MFHYTNASNHAFAMENAYLPVLQISQWTT